jgi:Fe2+ or Zn2+ uptake regulation protein
MELYYNNEISQLKTHGIRPLNHRVAVLEYLNKHRVHPTADDIYNGLKSTMASISRTTVYNVLHLLVDKNVVKTVGIDPQEMRYDANVTPHLHFKCEKCNKIFDIFDTTIPEIALEKEYKVHEVTVYLSGICPSCS